MTYSCVKCSLWILHCIPLMRRLKGQDVAGTKAKCPFTFVMKVTASRLICCVYLQLDTRVRGWDMTHHNLTLPATLELWISHMEPMMCLTRHLSTEMKIQPGNVQVWQSDVRVPELLLVFTRYLTELYTVPRRLQQRCIKNSPRQSTYKFSADILFCRISAHTAGTFRI